MIKFKHSLPLFDLISEINQYKPMQRQCTRTVYTWLLKTMMHNYFSAFVGGPICVCFSFNIYLGRARMFSFKNRLMSLHAKPDAE